MIVYELDAQALFKTLAVLTDREIFIDLHSTLVNGAYSIRGVLLRHNGNTPAAFQFPDWEAAAKQLEAQLANLRQNERQHLLATISRAETDIQLSRQRLARLDQLVPNDGKQN